MIIIIIVVIIISRAAQWSMGGKRLYYTTRYIIHDIIHRIPRYYVVYVLNKTEQSTIHIIHIPTLIFNEVIYTYGQRQTDRAASVALATDIVAKLARVKQ